MVGSKIIIDGKGAILGRLGTYVAKELLKGNFVNIINSEEVIVSGKKDIIVEKIRTRQRMGRGGSLKGPKYPRVEDKLLKRMIRGMLPWNKPRGREAYKKLRCYIGTEIFKEEDLKNIKKLEHKKPYRFASMKEITKALK